MVYGWVETVLMWSFDLFLEGWESLFMFDMFGIFEINPSLLFRVGENRITGVVGCLSCHRQLFGS